MTFGFGEKRCRKNLPLADPRSMKFAPMLAMIDMRGNLISAAILLVVGVVVFRLVRNGPEERDCGARDKRDNGQPPARG